MIFSTLKAYAFQGISLVLLGAVLTQTYRLHGAEMKAAKASTRLAEERAVAQAALATQERKNRDIETDLSTLAADTRKETNETINVSSSERNALLKRVRIAEANLATERLMSQTSPASCNGTGLKRPTGTELLATIGEEDVEEAHRGDVLRAHLTSCYRQYDEARKALSK